MNQPYMMPPQESGSNTGLIIGIVIVLIIIIGGVIGVAVYLTMPKESDSPAPGGVTSGIAVGTPVKISYSSTNSSLCSGTTPSIITATGIVTYVAGTTIGVTWNNMVNITPRTGLTAAQCTWVRAGKTDAWISDWFGTDKVNPVSNTGLLSVYDASNVSKLQRVERFRAR